MSSIPPNIIGSILQAQFSAAESAKKKDAQKNKRLRDARQMNRLTDQQLYEVEFANHVENVVVHPQQNKKRDGQETKDIYEQHAQNTPGKLYSQQSLPLNTDTDTDTVDTVDINTGGAGVEAVADTVADVTDTTDAGDTTQHIQPAESETPPLMSPLSSLPSDNTAKSIDNNSPDIPDDMNHIDFSA